MTPSISMYVPRPFLPSSQVTSELLTQALAGHLITSTSVGMLSTFVPWLLDTAVGEWGTLRGHIARANPQWSTSWQHDALVLVNGPDSYISPSWYPSKTEEPRVVPTWDYVILQLRGELVIHDDSAWVSRVVRDLTQLHEADQLEPWSVDDAPSAYIDSMLNAIVGVELRIHQVNASVKMSQTRSGIDIDGVIEGLDRQGKTAMANWMRHANGPH